MVSVYFVSFVSKELMLPDWQVQLNNDEFSCLYGIISSGRLLFQAHDKSSIFTSTIKKKIILLEL